jgi:hypothetical protein
MVDINRPVSTRVTSSVKTITPANLPPLTKLNNHPPSIHCRPLVDNQSLEVPRKPSLPVEQAKAKVIPLPSLIITRTRTIASRTRIIMVRALVMV